MSDTTQLGRRRLLKIGAAGAVGVGALSVPLGRAASGKQASSLASANFPKPYQVAFQRPPVLSPTSSTVDGDGIATNSYTVTETQGTAQIVPGPTTPVSAYNGSVPGPTSSRPGRSGPRHDAAVLCRPAEPDPNDPINADPARPDAP